MCALGLNIRDIPCTCAGGETAAAMVRSASVSAMAPPRTPVLPTPAFSGQPAEPQASAAEPVPYKGAASGAQALQTCQGKDASAAASLVLD